jgi:heme exporter protein B
MTGLRHDRVSQSALGQAASAWAVFLKDARLELRTRYALGALALFVAGSLVIARLALGDGPVRSDVAAAILWLIVLFAAGVGLGRSFVLEAERGTILLLQLTVTPAAVYAGKLLFNVALTLGMNAAAGLGVLVVLAPPLHAPGLFVATLLLGALGLAGATTLLAAVLARAAGSGPLLAVLAFPLLVPLLFSAVALTRLSFAPAANHWAAASQDLLALVGYAGLMITASSLLFEYVWRD